MANGSSDNKNINSASRVSHFFNVAKSNLSYGKVVRTSLFLLLAASVLLSLKTSSPIQAGIISLIAFIAFDVICLFKQPKLKDHTETIQALVDKNIELERTIKDVKGDISVVKISAGLGRK
jgi:hypothetical protein